MSKSSAASAKREARRWLAIASLWRLLSLLFQYPSRQVRQELRRLASGTRGPIARLAQGWASVAMRSAEAEYHRVLGPGGVPPVESSYDPNALAGRGPLLADIAAFHKAFSYAPQHPPAEVPDHIAAELDFLSYLAFKVAFAKETGKAPHADVTIQAYRAFLRDHLCNWIGDFVRRIEPSGPTVYLFASRQCQSLAEAAQLNEIAR
jgi:TorA maturation chaperone TorD